MHGRRTENDRRGRTLGARAALLAAIVALGAGAPAGAQQTVGLFRNDPGAFPGYTLWAPRYETVYLIDNEGREVNVWNTPYQPGNTVYLLPNGHLLHTAKDGPPGLVRFTAGGYGGRVEEYAFDGTLIWSWLLADDTRRLHHDIAPLPNGNVLMIVWELKSSAEAIAAGRDPALLPELELWPDYVIEVQPVGAAGANIVWEWHVWDHLIQDFDATKANFGVVADHPELLDVNHAGGGALPGQADWMHTNAIDYNAALDQILIGSNRLSEFWVIDHSTTTAEAAGHAGGVHGKGGDFLYRWGNPQAYDRGGPADQKLFGQHHPHWIPPGLPGEGNILIFNNRNTGPNGNYSSVVEIEPPVDGNGDYTLPMGAAYGPSGPVWTYTATPETDLFSGGLSGAQRLPNGNTLIVEGRGTTTNGAGNFFEIDTAGVTVWQYVNPIGNAGPIAQGAIPGDDHNVFRMIRYPVDYPGFDGEDLTPGDLLELFNAPPPAPDGSAATAPLTAEKLTAAGDQLRVHWDATSCPSFDYNLIHGDLGDVASVAVTGGECALGTSGTYDWSGVPAGDRFFLIVGVDDVGVYESSWGTDNAGAERNGTTPSAQCGTTNKVVSPTCP